MNTNVWANLSRDDLLMLWEKTKQALADAKEKEMELRKYIVARAFPNPNEGMNTEELGNGYQLKAGVKFNYKLVGDNKQIQNALSRIGTVGNQGAFIAERLVSWTPNFLLTEYRVLQEEAENDSPYAKEILKIIGEVLEVTDAAPSLEIKAPKAKK
jgi:hypothetical protein